MGKLAVKPKIDLAFKKIFSENQKILKALISAALNISVSDIQDMKLGNTEILPQDLNNKFCRLDLKVTMKGKVIDVEIQLNNHGNFQSRALYYWSRLFSQSLESGNDFKLLPETIVISFINFDLFGCSDYHSHFVLKEVIRNEILTDKLSLHFFELTKLPKEINKNKKIELWLKLISAETDEELYELENSQNEEIQEALDYVKKLNADDTFKRQIEMREIALIEEISALNFAKDEGEQKIINAMKKSGMSDEEIEKIIKISEKK
jgi:predicted transposase/invertase (TIGR01784 family)